MVLGLFGKSKKKKAPSGPPQDVAWVKSAKNRYFKFLNLEPDEMGLENISAVYVLWHQGVRPQWVYVGQTDDLGRTLQELRRDDEIVDYDKRGGLFVTWSMIKPEFQPGVVRYLYQVMQPVVVNPDYLDKGEDEKEAEEVEPIPVLLPGTSAPSGA
ncbi:MAG TPA: hypothetical protein VF987_00630 [Rhodospirillales bacterium]|jgi:hypothetical protein